MCALLFCEIETVKGDNQDTTTSSLCWLVTTSWRKCHATFVFIYHKIAEVFLTKWLVWFQGFQKQYWVWVPFMLHHRNDHNKCVEYGFALGGRPPWIRHLRGRRHTNEKQPRQNYHSLTHSLTHSACALARARIDGVKDNRMYSRG